jgi:hypothetical protein
MYSFVWLRFPMWDACWNIHVIQLAAAELIQVMSAVTVLVL